MLYFVPHLVHTSLHDIFQNRPFGLLLVFIFPWLALVIPSLSYQKLRSLDSASSEGKV